ncbi:MAG: MFS transporter [Pseudomonadota bacterium]|nr:MFS transporter [Pseudomonadota bacterium]
MNAVASGAAERMPVRALAGLALGNFAVGTGALVIAGVLPDVAADLQVPPAAAGQLITVYALSYAVGAPLLGAAASRLDRRRLLIGAGLLYALANLLAALSASFGMLLAARVLGSVGAALFSPTAATVASMLVAPALVPRAIGLVFGGFVISTVLGVPLGTWIGTTWGWQVALLFVSGLTVIATGVVALTLPGGLKAEGAGIGALVSTLKNTRLLVALSVAASNMASQFIPFTYIAVLLAAFSGATKDDVTVLFFAFGLASVVGNWLGGRAAARFGLTPTLLAGMLTLPVLFFALPAMHWGVTAAGVLLALWGMAGFSFSAPNQSRLVALAPHLRGVLLSLHASALYAGQAVGAAVGAFVLQTGTMDDLGWAAGIAALVTVALFLLSLWQWRPGTRGT